MEWFEDENFWLNFKEMMFDPERLARTPEDVKEMIALCGLHKGMKVLDCCCGFGRHALEFDRLGYTVTGFDLNAAYLETAQRKAKKLQARVEWELADIREFRRPSLFDFAYNFFTSFGYVEEPEQELKSIRNIYDSLKPGGMFLLDLEGKETLARDFCESQWFDGQDGSIMLVEAKIIDNWSRVQNRWGYIKDNRYTETVFAHKLYSAWELGELLAKSGFNRTAFYGSLQGQPYDENAQRLIAVAYKD